LYKYFNKKGYCFSGPINDFYKSFYLNDPKGYYSKSVTKYAETNPTENIAESFTKFTTWCFLSEEKKKDLAHSDTAAKILFFNLYPEMKQYRKDILENLAKISF
jgi:hypothetical protein